MLEVLLLGSVLGTVQLILIFFNAKTMRSSIDGLVVKIFITRESILTGSMKYYRQII
jgi:hypothetical protein